MRITGRRTAAGVGLALLLVGCGGDGDGEPATSTSPTAQPSAPTVEASGEATGADEAGEASEPATEEQSSEGQAGDGQNRYVVEEGDTLTEIAERFDTTVDALVEANDLDDPDVIIVGEELLIPQ